MTGAETRKSSYVTSAGVITAPSMPPGGRTMSTVRYLIDAVGVLMTFSLYLGRVCLSDIVKSDSFDNDVPLSKDRNGSILVFLFFTHALFQVPTGRFRDRFGSRKMLTGYILDWSALTAMTGFMTSWFGLLAIRLRCGVAQAGVYPTSNTALRRWTRPEQRGVANSLISFRPRLGCGGRWPFVSDHDLYSVHRSRRNTLWLYGVFSLLKAIGYWWPVRDRPSKHLSCNAAEQDLVGTLTDDHRSRVGDILKMLKVCCTSRSR